MGGEARGSVGKGTGRGHRGCLVVGSVLGLAGGWFRGFLSCAS